MANTVIHKDTDKEILTRERCYIRERLNDSAIGDVSIAATRVEPGITTELHRLTVAEWYVITSGDGLMQVGDEAAIHVSAGDIVIIPANTPQRITNCGDRSLIFDCICLPRFTPECYESLE